MKTRIKELRARYDFTQEDLARKVGVRKEGNIVPTNRKIKEHEIKALMSI